MKKLPLSKEELDKILTAPLPPTSRREQFLRRLSQMQTLTPEDFVILMTEFLLGENFAGVWNSSHILQYIFLKYPRKHRRFYGIDTYDDDAFVIILIEYFLGDTYPGTSLVHAAYDIICAVDE